MSRVEYRMSAEDLRTFDRWHARGAMALVAVLLTMPWILGIGPNAVRPADGPATIAAPPDVEAPATAPTPGATSGG